MQGFANVIWADGHFQFADDVHAAMRRVNAPEPGRFVTLGWENGAVFETRQGVTFSVQPILDTHDKGRVVAVLCQF